MTIDADATIMRMEFGATGRAERRTTIEPARPAPRNHAGMHVPYRGIRMKGSERRLTNTGAESACRKPVSKDGAPAPLRDKATPVMAR
ncbi:hypothetical protein [Burkholderia stagnalis]